jgi:hypothetical protein
VFFDKELPEVDHCKHSRPNHSQDLERHHEDEVASERVVLVGVVDLLLPLPLLVSDDVLETADHLLHPLPKVVEMPLSRDAGTLGLGSAFRRLELVLVEERDTDWDRLVVVIFHETVHSLQAKSVVSVYIIIN